ncbi:threonine-phosphate decarboxylase [Bacillus sp. V3B]|uniref:threonine-phosphate decarboxylase CobD n=1 Tax=Bacillus sp. V3B TaxID=2804915 RepID=UPI00210D5F0C|nr:threonine-phosphate decarboxylase CobD [Bacillus sp. V3B]MCQ6276939.1 threonine-phosphate decarboxylase [Bacillus sp. V3B]
MTWPSHGSNPHYLYEAAGLKKPDHVLDFSANINPFGPPSSIQENWIDFFQGIWQYPDPHTASLKGKLAEREGVLKEQILIGNGGAEMISLIGRLLAGKKVLIVEPAFSEYEKACQINDCDISYFQLAEGWEIDSDALRKKLSQVDAVFFCNPNNPTGLYYPLKTILPILRECETQNCFLIVDEAFHDFLMEYEPLSPLIKEYTRLILLRSLTKMFAIPGLRLGYAIASREIITKLSDYRPHWSVNSVALAVGDICVAEKNYIEETVQFIHSEREKLVAFYEKNGFEVSYSKVNFYLLRDPQLVDPYPLFQFLLQKGIVPRHTFNFPGLEGRWLRFAIRNREENQKLKEAMQEWRMIHPLSL